MRLDEDSARAARLCEDMLEMVLHVLEERAEVIIPEAFTHPHTSIACLAPSIELAKAARNTLQCQFETLLWAEDLAQESMMMRRILAEVPWRRWTAICLYMFVNDVVLDKGNEDPSGRLAALLRPIHIRIPDEKGAEDMHQYLRDEGRRNRFDKVSAERVFRTCRDSAVPVRIHCGT